MINLNKYKLIEIEKIEIINENIGVDVYDLSVENDESYVVDDYIVHNCNTTKNTGVGQIDLCELIKECDEARDNLFLIRDVKIVADGISSYISLCENKYGYLDNGYATINKLLYNGADLIMIGKLFAQCEESSGDKKYSGKIKFGDNDLIHSISDLNSSLLVKYQGMSTKEAQSNYNTELKHSEGNTSWVDVKWSLNEWLNGSEKNSDYLPGFINCLKSAMSYVGAKKLNEFFEK